MSWFERKAMSYVVFFVFVFFNGSSCRTFVFCFSVFFSPAVGKRCAGDPVAAGGALPCPSQLAP